MVAHRRRAARHTASKPQYRQRVALAGVVRRQSRDQARRTARSGILPRQLFATPCSVRRAPRHGRRQLALASCVPRIEGSAGAVRRRRWRRPQRPVGDSRPRQPVRPSAAADPRGGLRCLIAVVRARSSAELDVLARELGHPRRRRAAAHADARARARYVLVLHIYLEYQVYVLLVTIVSTV